MLNRSIFRQSLGIVTAIVVALVLDIIRDSFGLGLGLVSYLEMMLLTAIPVTIACIAGGLVARQKFVATATVLAFIVWCYVTALSLSFGVALDDVSWDRFFMNLPNAVMIPAAALGAFIGNMLASKGPTLRSQTN